jgi:hypothetical protein
VKQSTKTNQSLLGGSRWTLGLVLLVSCLASRCGSSKQASAGPTPPPQSSTGSSYSTNFAATESPISDDGHWTNGKVTGLDWANVNTTPALAYGTETGNNGYDDSTAVLTGTWGSNQTVEATVHSVNQTDNVYEEVEIRLRSALSSHVATGYEINFRCSKTSAAYVQIVRWDGGLGKFTYVATQGGVGVQDGDVVKATIVGNVITAYINGAQVVQGTDDTYTTGNPGMGFFLGGATGINTKDYGFSTFKATD